MAQAEEIILPARLVISARPALPDSQQRRLPLLLRRLLKPAEPVEPALLAAFVSTQATGFQET